MIGKVIKIINISSVILNWHRWLKILIWDNIVIVFFVITKTIIVIIITAAVHIWYFHFWT